MRPFSKTYTVAGASTTGFASNVTGASWTLTATSAGDGLAHQVTIHNDAAVDHSAKTATLVGTDSDGKAQTVTINLPGISATVTTTTYWLTLTSVTPSASIGADTMDIGWTQTARGQTIPVDRCSPYATYMAVDITGTINFTIEETLTNVLALTNPNVDAFWTASTSFSGKTADTVGSIIAQAAAWRFVVTTVTNGCVVTIYTNQADNHSGI